MTYQSLYSCTNQGITNTPQMHRPTDMNKYKNENLDTYIVLDWHGKMQQDASNLQPRLLLVGWFSLTTKTQEPYCACTRQALQHNLRKYC